MKAQRAIGIGRITAAAARRLQVFGVNPDCVLIDHAAGRWGVVPWSIVEHNYTADRLGYGGWIAAHDLGAGEYLILLTNVTLDAADRRTFIYLSSEGHPDITGKG